jgi:hypothetical protein
MDSNALVLFKWVGNNREDTAFPSHEVAQLFCNWINTKDGVDTEVSDWDLPEQMKGAFGIDNRWVDWSEAREFSNLFDLEVKEYESV